MQGVDNDDSKEVVKGGSVFAAATSASVIGQAVGFGIGAIFLTPAGAFAVAYTLGCVSGICAGAASEVVVDKLEEDDALPEVDTQTLRRYSRIAFPSEGAPPDLPLAP
jgi:hypothetical protein